MQTLTVRQDKPRSKQWGGGSRPPTLLLGLLGLATFFALWTWGSATNERLIPPLAEVVVSIPEFVAGDIWGDVGASSLRVVGSLMGALIVGFFAAWVIARQGFWGSVISRYVDLAVGLPSTILALMALMIFKRSEFGVIFVVLVACFPFIVINLRQGITTLSASLIGMTRVYHFGTWRGLRHLTVPHLVPYAMSAVRNEYAHAWRVVVLAEIFAVNSGIGWRFTQAFDRFHLDQVVLWLLTFMVLLLGSEYLILRPIEKLALRWRGENK